ncbi:MAG: relaxase domain-containing protein, partial [Actinomycetota bacterium]|nr:relaxase domain-containing protein [Actinomycetota bacterium]
MLNIGKLAAGSHEYYLASVAAGTEDYYLARGEPRGYWLARGGTELGLDGMVTREALRAVLDGHHPSTGAPLLAQTQRTVPGFDLTFLAPKSVSVLYGLGDRRVAREVQTAHDAAVEAALGYLERHAAWSRRGAGGAEQVRSNGFVAAAFRHRTSRAGDPLVHTHVLVANLARAVDDGRWRTLDGRHLYTHARTAGFLYQAQLRAELTRRLGVEWEPVANGCADIAGVPRRVVAAFSTRRREIEAHMAERGETSAKAAQVATLATRRAKDHRVDV